MKVGFVGAGKVGTAIGCYLCKKGIQVAGYYSRSLSSAMQAASRTVSRIYDDLGELAGEADLIAMTVPDDVIAAVAWDLSEMPVCWENKIVLHMSGVHASDILAPLGQKGATVCSLHPMLSFGDVDTAVSALNSAPFTIEGKGMKLDTIKEILEACGNTWTEISTSDKVLYHAAACVMSNYLVALLDVGIEMLQAAGFTDKKARELSGPLIGKTLENVINTGTAKALTGPISRGDAGTLERHVEKLKDCSKRWLELYKVLGLYTVELAKRAEKIDETSAIRMQEVLKRYE